MSIWNRGNFQFNDRDYSIEDDYTEDCLQNLRKFFFENRGFLQLGSDVPTRQLGLFVNLGKLELTYLAQTFMNYSFSSEVFVKDEATL